MSGKFKGCQAKVSEYLGRDIPYFPYLAHRVNTTVEHSCNASVSVAHMFDVLQQLYVFFTSSTKRYAVFQQHIKEKNVDGALELRNLSMTRCIARSDSITVVWASFERIVSALQKETETDDAKKKVMAKGILAQVKSLKFIVALMFIKNVMSKTKIIDHKTTESNRIPFPNMINQATVPNLAVLKNKGLKCMYTNPDCLSNKLQELQIRLIQSKTDLCAVTEILPRKV